MKKTTQFLGGFLLISSLLSLSGCNITRTKTIDGDWAYIKTSAGEQYEVADYLGSDTEIVVPAEFNNLPVTVISNSAFKGDKNITSITLPDSIVVIAMSAFENMSNLKSINIPNELTVIAEDAFKNCPSLTSDIILDNHVTVLGESIFEGCSSITYAYLDEEVTVVGKNIFKGCTSLEQIETAHNEKPLTWADKWNPDNISVAWNVMTPTI